MTLIFYPGDKKKQLLEFNQVLNYRQARCSFLAHTHTHVIVSYCTVYMENLTCVCVCVFMWCFHYDAEAAAIALINNAARDGEKEHHFWFNQLVRKEREDGENEDTHQELSKAGIQENLGQTGVSEMLKQKLYWAWLRSDSGLGGCGPGYPTEEDNPEVWASMRWRHGNLPWPGFSPLVPWCSQTQLEGFKHPGVRVGLERWLHRGLYFLWATCSPWPGRSEVSVTRGGIVTPH